MLVLSRKRGQGLVIDGTTVVRILEVRGNQIRIGIEAPGDVRVVRTELQLQEAGCPEGHGAGLDLTESDRAAPTRRPAKSR